MDKIKVLAICGSPRKGKQTEQLLEVVLEGARSVGANTEMVTLCDKDLKPCRGCMSCQKGKPCLVEDDLVEIFDKIAEADAIVMGSPVYFCDVTAQMKMLIDRSFAKAPINGNKVGAIATVAGSIGCSGVVDTFNRFFAMQGITPAGFVALYGKTDDKEKGKKVAFKMGVKVAKQAKFQRDNDDEAYDGLTHFAYGTHTF